ncbi:hypothetical protein [Actinomadura sp. 3N508]|uniref:hypothetical protein n=1 Tax=Actinomadura sp. 3N508 TaxID=3375153 RepID=UPI0037886E95
MSGEAFHVTITDQRGQVRVRLRQQSATRYEVLSPRGDVLGIIAHDDEWSLYGDISTSVPVVFGPDVFGLAVAWADKHARLVDALPQGTPAQEGPDAAGSRRGGVSAEDVDGLADRARALLGELRREANLLSLRDVSDPSGIELTRRFCQRLETLLREHAGA